MFYQFVKVIARTAIKFYIRDLRLNKKDLLKSDGPLMLAVNHPNSFLDAIILCTLFDQPVYSLARGDVFKKKWLANILFSLKLLPVYRVSEGVENLELRLNDAVNHLNEIRTRNEEKKTLAELRRNSDATQPEQDQIALLQKLQEQARRPDLRRVGS